MIHGGKELPISDIRLRLWYFAYRRDSFLVVTGQFSYEPALRILGMSEAMQIIYKWTTVIFSSAEKSFVFPYPSDCRFIEDCHLVVAVICLIIEIVSNYSIRIC